MSFFSKLIQKFQNKSKAVDGVSYLALEDLESLEETLISSDLGPSLSAAFVEYLRKELKGFMGLAPKSISQDELPEIFTKFIAADLLEAPLDLATPKIIMLLGVNGVGKTTSAAKLAYYFKSLSEKLPDARHASPSERSLLDINEHREGEHNNADGIFRTGSKSNHQEPRILLVAADTFRAAASEQLSIWAQKIGVDIIKAESDKEKSSSVIYRALQKQDDYNIIIIDTAGRLQNKTELMQELRKLSDIIQKNAKPQTQIEQILVLDASTGQNAISQAELFNSVSKLTAIILTKYDSTSKAGVLLSLMHKFKLAVKFLGQGEGIADLRRFQIQEFLAELFQKD